MTVVTDPIDLPSFHPNLGRPANPERIARIRRLAEQRRNKMMEADKVRDLIREEVREAKAAGHSYSQLADAAGVSIGVIQRMTADE